jgi:photosystem II stability/assembly factor-like uncharacterized protein
MKSNPVILVLLAVASCASQSYAQLGWSLQHSGTSECLWGVSFADVITGFAVGNNGSILRTTDGGTVWWKVSSGTAQQLLSVHFTDVLTGTAVGSSGIVLRTTNGGAGWVAQSSNTAQCLRGVFFVDTNNGTAVGDNGTIIHTTDGGNAWTALSSGTSVPLCAVRFISSMRGLVVGYGGTILRTTDGGTSWLWVVSGTDMPLHGIAFSDSNTGIVVGGIVFPLPGARSSSAILCTPDGGRSWVSRSSPTPMGLSGVCFSDKETVFAIGGSCWSNEYARNGLVIRSTNRGESWGVLVDSMYLLTGVYSCSPKNITAVGFWGTVVATSTGGVTSENDTQGDRARIPWHLALHQNYPNPFNPSTTIRYELPTSSFVRLSVYDMLGREVSILVNERKDAGSYDVKFNAAGLSSGVYFCRVTVGEDIFSKKMLIVE